MMTTGWEWDQDASSTYWTIQFLPYIETQMDMTSEFYIDRLITSTFEIAMNKIQTSAYYALTFDTSGQICTSFGWKTSRAITVDVTYQYETQDC